jgi:hypothetical protein
MLMFKQFGVGLATAILIDATIVRGVLLPASMKLLGDWNWYLPRWLRWLPRFDLGESGVEAEAAPAPARRRRRSRFLTGTGVLLVTVGLVAALSPAGLTAGTGNRHERPRAAAELERSYDYGIGNFNLDLRDVELAAGTTRIEVDLAIGNLVVRVPEHAALVVDAHLGAGEVSLFGETSDGTDVDERAVVRAPADAPRLVLEADVGFGHLEVRR